MHESSERAFAKWFEVGSRKHAQNQNTDAKPICPCTVLFLSSCVCASAMRCVMQPLLPTWRQGIWVTLRGDGARFLQPCLARVWIVPSIRRGLFLLQVRKGIDAESVSVSWRQNLLGSPM